MLISFRDFNLENIFASIGNRRQLNEIANDKLGYTSDEMYQHIIAMHRKLAYHFTDYSIADKAAAANYMDSSNDLNNRLHNGMNTDDWKLKEYDDMVNRHTIKQPLIVYSGIKEKHAKKLIEISKKLQTKRFQVHHPAFLSTSLSPNEALYFSNYCYDSSFAGRHILKIKVPAGAKGAYVAHLNSALERERELILPRGHRLSVLASPEKVENTADNLWLWKAKLVKW